MVLYEPAVPLLVPSDKQLFSHLHYYMINNPVFPCDNIDNSFSTRNPFFQIPSATSHLLPSTVIPAAPKNPFGSSEQKL